MCVLNTHTVSHYLKILFYLFFFYVEASLEALCLIHFIFTKYNKIQSKSRISVVVASKNVLAFLSRTANGKMKEQVVWWLAINRAKNSMKLFFIKASLALPILRWWVARGVMHHSLQGEITVVTAGCLLSVNSVLCVQKADSHCGRIGAFWVQNNLAHLHLTWPPFFTKYN